MQNKEIKKAKKSLKEFAYMYGTLSAKEAKNILQYIDQLENKVKELEATKDKYLQKLVYALTDNIDLETCKIKRKLKEFWGIDKYWK